MVSPTTYTAARWCIFILMIKHFCKSTHDWYKNTNSCFPATNPQSSIFLKNIYLSFFLFFKSRCKLCNRFNALKALFNIAGIQNAMKWNYNLNCSNFVKLKLSYIKCLFLTHLFSVWRLSMLLCLTMTLSMTLCFYCSYLYWKLDQKIKIINVV